MNVSDFNITGRAIPQDIADKIVTYHLVPLWFLQKNFSQKISVSAKSGYRPEWYEIKKGRSGSSQHTFKHEGAVDITCADFVDNQEAFMEALLKHTEYTRLCLYDSFIHADYRKKDGRSVYRNNSKNKWVKLYDVQE
jgi:hypothetical protein